MSIFSCLMNAGMERSFFFRKNGRPCDISKSNKYSVFFDIENLNTPHEKRFLLVVERSSGVQKLKVLLNENAGAKPTHDDRSPHQPQRRPNPRLNIPIDTDAERIFFAEINLSADPNISVFLRIFPRTIEDDKKRYLTFIQTGSTAVAFDIEDIDLKDEGGKKPLGGSTGSLTTSDDTSNYEIV